MWCMGLRVHACIRIHVHVPTIQHHRESTSMSDLRVLRDSSWCRLAGLMVAIMAVLELPPRLSFSNL